MKYLNKMKELVCKKYIAKDSNGKIMFKSYLNDAIEQGDISHDDALSISLELMYGIKNYEFNETTVLNELENLVLKVREYNLNENDIIKNSVLFFNDYSYEKEVLSEYIDEISPEDCVNVEGSKPQNDKPKDIKKYFDHLSRDDLCYILGKNPDLTYEKDKVLKKQIANEFSKYDFDSNELSDASIENIKKYLETLVNKSNELKLEIRKQKQNYNENSVQINTNDINDNGEVSTNFTKKSDKSRITLQCILEKARKFNAMSFRNMLLLKSNYAEIYEEVTNNNFEYLYNDIKKFIYYFSHFDEIKDAIKYIEQLRRYNEDLNKFYVEYNNVDFIYSNEYENLYNLASKINNYHVYLRNKITDEFPKLNYFMNTYMNFKNEYMNVANKKTNVPSNEKEEIFHFKTSNFDLDALIKKIRIFNYKKLSSMVLLKSEFSEIYQEISRIDSKKFNGNGDIKRFKYYFEHFDLVNECIELIDKIKQKENLLDNFNTNLKKDKVDKLSKTNLILEFKELYVIVYPINKYDYCLKDKIIDEFDNLDYFIEYYENLLDKFDFKTNNYMEMIHLVELIEKIKLFYNKKLEGMVSSKKEYEDIYQEISNLDPFNISNKYYAEFIVFIDSYECCNGLLDLFNKIKQNKDLINNFCIEINSGEYLSKSRRNELIKKYKEFYNLASQVYTYPEGMELEIFDRLNNLERFLTYFSGLLHYDDYEGKLIKEINEKYIENEINKDKSFFKDIKDKNKKRAILCDKDNVKVVAGAGAGKTFIIEKKIKYLIEKRNKDPKKILCLCFTRKNVNQLKRALKKSKISKVKVFTFHEFCRIVAEECDKKKRSNRYLLDDVIRKYLFRIVRNPKKLNDLMEYFSYSQYEEKNMLNEYEEYREGDNLVSLKNKVYSKDEKIIALNEDSVDSREELIIANYLFMHEIDYEYHKFYPYNYYAFMIENRFLFSGSYFSLNQISHSSNEELIKKFIKWEKARILSQPDFYIPEKDLYLEHFGVDKNREATFLTGDEKEKYEMDMHSKEVFHELYGTKLIETCSYHFSEGRLLKKLEKLLRDNGITIGLMDKEKIIDILIDNDRVNEFKNLSKLIKSFINIYESNNLKKIDFNEYRLKNTSKDIYTKKRQALFLDMVEEIYEEYCDRNSKKEASHNYEIFNALRLIKSKEFNKKYDYIFVDEYQDINRVRCKLLQELQINSNSKLFVVGDDWQSIYGFAGSEVELFINFHKYFKNPEIIQIGENRRNQQKLIDITTNFMKDYNSQDYRKLKYYKDLNNPNINPIKIVKYGSKKESKILKLDAIMTDILKRSKNPRILILGRNNYDIDDYVGNSLFIEKEENNLRKIIYYERQDLEICYMTIHQAKGLEADEVIVLNFEDKYDGFPNKMMDDPILDFVKDYGECEFSEERRILYVALTRTRNNVYLLSSISSPSKFISELEKYDGVETTNFKHRILKNYLYSDKGFVEEFNYHPTNIKCPYCENGQIIIVENLIKKTKYVRCSLHPHDSSHYNGGPLPSKYSLNDIKYIEKCPYCDGVLIRKRNILQCCFNYKTECLGEKKLILDEKDLEFDFE